MLIVASLAPHDYTPPAQWETAWEKQFTDTARQVSAPGWQPNAQERALIEVAARRAAQGSPPPE